MLAMLVPTWIREVLRAIASAQASASPLPSLTRIAVKPFSSASWPSWMNSLGGASVAVESTTPRRDIISPFWLAHSVRSMAYGLLALLALWRGLTRHQPLANEL